MSDRREFIGTLAAGVTVAAEGVSAQSGEIPRRKLGRTGESVSCIGLGGFHIGTPSDQQTSTKIIRTAIDSGINFMDNCWDYHDGKSEDWMGQALADGYRNKVFLMSKIDGRNKQAAAKQIDESLKRLRTDHVDLMQMHEIIRPNEPEQIWREGAMQALFDAKKAGKELPEPAEEKPSNVINLMDALKRSVKGDRGSRSSAATSTRRSAKTGKTARRRPAARRKVKKAS